MLRSWFKLIPGLQPQIYVTDYDVECATHVQDFVQKFLPLADL